MAPDLPEKDKPTNGLPKIVKVAPARLIIGSDRPVVNIFGYNFDEASRVLFGDAERRTQYIAPTHLVATLDSSDLEPPGTRVVKVAKANATSNAVTLMIAAASEAKGVWKIFWWKRALANEPRLLLLVIFTGTFGAAIMALRSLADYQGQSKLFNNWTIHYVVRPPSGAGVAFVFYLVIRGGFMAGTDVDIGGSTPFGIVAVAALAEMFSEKAFNKLGKVFEAMFTTDKRSEGLETLAIEQANLKNAKVNQQYSQQLKANGGTPPYKWSMENQPSWLQLDEKTGLLSGSSSSTVAKTGFTITVTDANGTTASRDFEVAVE